MKYNRIFIDIDGVLADFAGRIIKNYNCENNTNFTIDDIDDWNFSNIIRDGDCWTNYVDKKFWLLLEPLPWAVELVKTVENTGSQLAFLTNIGDGNEYGLADRKKWLENNLGFIEKVGKRLINAKNKGLVVTKGDLLIDDSSINVQNALTSGAEAVTLKQNWNYGAHNRKTAYEIIEMLKNG